MLSRFFKLISRIVLPHTVVVGLGIEDRHLFAVATSRKGDDQKILASGTYEFPEGTIEDGELKKPEVIEKATATLLAQLLPKSSFRVSQEPIFVLSIPPEHLYTEAVFFPSLEEPDLSEAIRLKIETSLPWPVKESYVDWSMITTSNPEETGIFIAAISKPVLDQYLKIFFNHNWRIGATEFHLLSLSRFITPLYAKSFIFILVDEDGVEFMVFAHGTIVVHHVQPLPSAEIRQFFEDKVRQLTSYLESHYGGEKIEKIFLFAKTGGEDTPSAIAGIPAEPFHPSPGVAARLTVAYGASLRPYGIHEALINLIPTELGGRYEENLFFKTVGLWINIFFTFTLTFLAAFAAVYLFLVNQNDILKKGNASFAATLEQQNSQLEPLFMEADYFNQLAQAVVDHEALRSHIGGKLALLTDEIGKFGISLQNGRIGASEASLTLLFPTRQSAIDFQARVNALNLFQPVAIPIRQLTEEKNLSITLVLQYL